MSGAKRLVIPTLPEVKISLRHFQMIVIALCVQAALMRKPGDAGFMIDQVAELFVHVVLIGQDVDDGANVGTTEQIVGFGFASAHHHQPLCHGLEGIHGGGVGIELIEQDIARKHGAFVLVEGKVFDRHDLHLVGAFGLQAAQSAQHDVGAFVAAATALHSDKKAHRSLGGKCHLDEIGNQRGVIHVDREGNEAQFVGKLGAIGRVILIESRDNAVAVLGHPRVELAFGTVEPLGNPNVVVLTVPLLRSEIEVAVTKRATVQSGLDPIAIHAESAKKDAPIPTPQRAVEGAQALSAQRKEHGIDELDDVVAFETTKGAPQSPKEGHCGAPIHAVAFQINVAGVAFPAIAVGGQRDFVPERAEPRRECGVDIGIVAEE